VRRPENRPFSIVVGFDFSELGKLALAESMGLASLNDRTVLHIIGVVDSSSGLGPVEPESKADHETVAQVQQEIIQVVEGKIKKYSPSDFRCFIHVRLGEPAEEIISLAEESGADIVVIGSHGRSGIERLLLGSVSEKVVRDAPCPVLAMRPRRADLDMESDVIEPPCPECVNRRVETNGAEWWCAAHSKTYVPPHRYSYSSGIVDPIAPDSWSIFNH